jgi:glutamate racemase
MHANRSNCANSLGLLLRRCIGRYIQPPTLPPTGTIVKDVLLGCTHFLSLQAITAHVIPPSSLC